MDIFGWIRRLGGYKNRGTKTPASARAYRPLMEALEDRQLLNAGWGGGFGRAPRSFQENAIFSRGFEQHGHGHAQIVNDDTEQTETGDDSLTATNLNQIKTYTEGAASVALDDIVISNTDADATVTAKLKLADADAGSLTATSGNGETYNADTGVWSVTGTVTAVNATLAAVAFTPNADNDVDTQIAVNLSNGTSTSGGHCGPSGYREASMADGTISLDVNPVNDTPTATNLEQTQSYTTGAASVDLDDIVVSDPDSNETLTATVSLANAAAGTLSDAQNIGVSDATAGTWTVTGSLKTVNTALASLTFTPAASNTESTTAAVQIRDAAGTGPDGTISLNVATSTAPTATNLTQAQSYTTGAASVALDDIVVSDTDSAATITATLTLANPAAGALTATSGNGESYDATTGIWSITGATSAVNGALAAITFAPAANNVLDTSVAVQIQDAAGLGPNGTITLTVL